MRTKRKGNDNSTSIKNQPWKKKPRTLLLLLSLLTIFLLLLRLSQNKIILIATEANRKSFGDTDACLGRYVYINDLPSRFNREILQNCDAISRPSDKISMCIFVLNSGFGPVIGEFSGDGVSTTDDSPSCWFATNQFMLEVIFHEKMKRYKCLTKNSSLASAIYIPYYAGLDFRRNLRRRKVAARDAAGKYLVKWLREQPEWKVMSGQDHFLVTGRISRDFRRNSSSSSGWGTNLMLLPESRNLSFLTIERNPKNKNEFAIPYPTYFHPNSAFEILQWQNKITLVNRTILSSFAGAERPSRSQNGVVRSEVIRQCKSSKMCRFLDCNVKTSGCDDPINLMKLFKNSVFCLQPPGDSLTRRSVFDSILAGCIPVFFNQRVDEQYVWHIPKNTEFSVYIPVKKLKTGGKNRIEEILRRIPKERVASLRENVIRLLPKIVYTKPNRDKPDRETLEDAFDIAVKGVINRIERIRRNKNKNQEHVVYN